MNVLQHCANIVSILTYLLSSCVILWNNVDELMVVFASYLHILVSQSLCIYWVYSAVGFHSWNIHSIEDIVLFQLSRYSHTRCEIFTMLHVIKVLHQAPFLSFWKLEHNSRNTRGGEMGPHRSWVKRNLVEISAWRLKEKKI